MTIHDRARGVFGATPEPTAAQRQIVRARFEAGRIGETAPRPPRRPRVAGALMTAGGIAAIAALLIAALPRGADDPPNPAAPSVLPLLEEPQDAADRLPAPVLERLTRMDPNLDPASVRLARVAEGRKYYVALSPARQRPGGAIRTADALCLIDVRTADTPRGPRLVGGANCQELTEGGRFILISEIPKGQVDRTVRLDGRPRGGLVAGVVPPGYGRVSLGAVSVAPVNGVFLLRSDDLSAPVVADGPQGTIRLGLGITPEPTLKRGRGSILPLGVFRRAARPADALPARTRRALERSRSWPDLLLDRARFAGSSTDGRRYWLIPRSGEDDRIAVARVLRRGGLSSSGMLLPRADQPLVLDWRPAYRGPFRNANVFVSGMAADGYTRAEAGGKVTAIRDNFFVIRDIAGVGYVTVTISGPAGSHTVNVNAGFPQYRNPFVLRR